MGNIFHLFKIIIWVLFNNLINTNLKMENLTKREKKGFEKCVDDLPQYLSIIIHPDVCNN